MTQSLTVAPIAMDVHVINLDRSVARLDEFRRWNAHMPDIERFAAIDGATVDRRQFFERNIIAEDLRYTDAALGCALSHLSLWEMASTKSAVITVCEDDAILHASFRDIASRLIGTLPKDWDIVVWGWNFDSILSFDMMPGIARCRATFDQRRFREMFAAFQSRPLSPQLFRLFRAFGTVCYSISAAGSRKLLERAIPLGNFTLRVRGIKTPELPNVGIDVVMTAAYPSLNAFVSFPPLAVTKNDHAVSTIRGSLRGNQQ